MKQAILQEMRDNGLSMSFVDMGQVLRSLMEKGTIKREEKEVAISIVCEFYAEELRQEC